MIKVTKGKIALIPIIIGLIWFMYYGLFVAGKNTASEFMAGMLLFIIVIGLISLWVIYIATKWDEEFSWLRRRR